MRLSALKPTFFRFGAFGSMPDVRDDASDLISWHGERAYETAQLKSFQEGIGLVLTLKPGHWDRVAREIAARGGRRVAERRADFTASAAGQRL